VVITPKRLQLECTVAVVACLTSTHKRLPCPVVSLLIYYVLLKEDSPEGVVPVLPLVNETEMSDETTSVTFDVYFIATGPKKEFKKLSVLMKLEY
jgi:hypothetical protein